MGSLKSFQSVAGFYFKRHFFDQKISDTPSFDDEGARYFEKQLARCSMYLEYGSGGSTIMAARSGKPFITVENDAIFLAAVRKKIESEFDKCAGSLLYVNTGAIGVWGYPLLKRQTPSRMARWRTYPEAPWELIKTMSRYPDTILVDGRFRVACALVSIKNLYGKVDFQILVDDYQGRSYCEIEKFTRLDRMYGRMAVFKTKEIEQSELEAAIEKFVRDYR